MTHTRLIAGLLALGFLSFATFACVTGARKLAAHQPDATTAIDPNLWLEEIESPEALSWVKTHNAKSAVTLAQGPRFEQMREQIHSILVAKDRIASPSIANGWVYNFWQDGTHVKGLWRRTRPADYEKAEPNWETILDLDLLSKQEGESWVWKGSSCLAPDYEKCLISLSKGGKDAVVVREFDIGKLAFVPDGFILPEAKSSVSWMDVDTLWVGTDFGPGSLTQSGYPRLVKLWKRGAPLSSAKQVFEGKNEDISAGGFTYFGPSGPIHGVYRSPSFFESEQFVYLPQGELKKIPLPADADFKGVFGDLLLASLRTDWRLGKRIFPAGALVSVPLKAIIEGNGQSQIETVYAPNARSTLSAINISRSALYLDILENVSGKTLKITRSNSHWQSQTLPFPDKGVVNIVSSDPFAEEIFAQFESFLIPTTLFAYSGEGAPRAVKSLPPRFDSKNMVVEQFESVSKDGTPIPYFLIHKKGMPLDGKQPTLLYGYGGFEVSMTPFYMGGVGKVWLEQGGVYALANIRGGGEFGPKWHQAAILENRQKAYDDFISVAEDMIERRVTSKQKLGIMGGSNGGLLMGVMFTERPDLFKAVVCQVPLLDMFRYHKLLAGASWMGEYGNPEDPAMTKVIGAYSPYQNVKAGVKYPKVYFETSTKDDRVHPGHARKMVARMEAQGHEVIYFENIEGGHSAAADLEQRATRSAMEYNYLWGELNQ